MSRSREAVSRAVPSFPWRCMLMIANMTGMTAGMAGLVEQLRERTARLAQGGSESARTKHTDRGKMLARDRIDALLDPGSPFLELSPLAAYGMYAADNGENDDFAVPSASI